MSSTGPNRNYVDIDEIRDATHLCIRVWRWRDAPSSLRALSPHGGDEDWVALAPATVYDEYIGWLASGTAFGVSEVSRHELADKSVVYIGAHS